MAAPDTPASPQRPPRRWRRWATAAAVATAFGFPGAVSPLLPVRHWLFDLPASFAPQCGAALLTGALLLAAVGRIRLALLWLAGLLAALAAVLPPMREAAHATAPGPARLRVLTMNLQRGTEQNADAMLATVAAAAPDVLFLCEVTPAWWSRTAATLLRTFPYHHERPDPGYFGVALWSRFPLQQAADFGLPYDWAPAIRATVECPDGDVGVLGVHLPRPGLGSSCSERDQGLAAIPGALTGLPYRVLICGDCNATPWNRSFRDLLATSQGRLRDAGCATFTPTWPTNWPWPLRIPIDHLLLGGDLRAVETRVLPDWGSDHSPLFAAVVW